MLLKLTDLKFNYDVENHKQVKALRGLSLCIDEGQMLSLVGESGCGKTTLCNIHSNDLKGQENIVKQLNILLVLKVKLVKEGSKRRHRNL